MPQIINGQIIAAPGPAGSAPIYLLVGAVDPGASSDPNVAQASLGSLYINYSTPSLWFKTALPNSWTQK